jgi:uncharacterized protein
MAAPAAIRYCRPVLPEGARMQYVLYCLDKPDGLAVRKANRDAHVAHLRGAIDHIIVAGPLLSDGGDMIGSLIVVEFADKAALDAFVANDPYAKAGLFQSVSVKAWKKVLP